MYDILLATPAGRSILALVFDPQMVARMIELSNRGLPAVGALSDGLPAKLPNRYKRLAGYLVKRVMLFRGYAPVPGCGRVGNPLAQVRDCSSILSIADDAPRTSKIVQWQFAKLIVCAVNFAPSVA